MIHYELPNNTETFVHRTGRTGRAGKKGSAILIYSQDQSRAVKIIEREVGSRFTEVCKSLNANAWIYCNCLYLLLGFVFSSLALLWNVVEAYMKE